MNPLWVAQAAPAQPSLLGSMLPMLIIFGIFYVIWFLPLRRKQKAHDKFLDELEKGARVVTNGGFFGEVTRVEGEIVHLKLADKVVVQVSKRAIAGLQGSGAEKGQEP